MSFAKNMSKNLRESISKYSQSLHALKTPSKRTIQTTEDATGDLNRNKFADKILKVLRASSQSNAENMTNEEENIGIEKYLENVIYPQKKDKTLLVI